MLAKPSIANSYSIRSLSSRIYITNECYLKIVEYFEYEFTGSFARIGRALPALTSNALERSVTFPSNSIDYSIKTEFEIIQDSPYIVMYLNPPTPENMTIRLSFILSYIIYGSTLFQTSSTNRNLVSYYYKDKYPIINLNVTFMFDPNMDLALPPSPGEDDGIISFDQRYSVSYSKHNVDTEFIPTVIFKPIFYRFECTGGNNLFGLLLGLLIPVGLVITIFFCAKLNKRKKNEDQSTTSQYDDNNTTSQYYTFNDNNYTVNNDSGNVSSHRAGSGFAD